jgi:5-methylcytosine-specific restriction endonuclease McrA
VRNLTNIQSKLHGQALRLSRTHRRVEWRLIVVIQKIEHDRFYKQLGHSSLYKYAVDGLGLTESVAYAFISVARMASQVEKLQAALRDQKMLNEENADELLAFAMNHSSRETDFEVARRNPKKDPPDRSRPLSEDRVEVKMSMSRSAYNQLRRAQSLMTEECNESVDFGLTVEHLLNDYLPRHDPVLRAGRAILRNSKRKSVKKLRTFGVKAVASQGKRIPLTAEQRHEVFARDGGRCTHIDSSGKRCQHDRWLHIHHIVPVSEGGSNDPENLTTLCSFHHDLAHQLPFVLEAVAEPPVRPDG